MDDRSLHASRPPRRDSPLRPRGARACDAENQSIGSKEIRTFIDASIYERYKGRGLPAGKRVFRPDALEALSLWSHSDVLPVHKAV